MKLRHARVELKLHTLQPGEGAALLLLHALGGSSADWDVASLGWPGPVHALDLSGHGVSGRVYGGVYYPELWAADADLALAELGEACLAGAGVGAYAALLLAGARPQQVPAVVLSPGAGLDGVGELPEFHRADLPTFETTPLARDCLAEPRLDPTVRFADFGPRPTEYSDGFARAARRVILCDDDAPRPPWWRSLRSVEGVERHAGSLREALSDLRATPE